jgi:UDP-glucose 4-epimerase
MAEGELVLVTGAAGFIGSHLCDALLAAGFRVRAADRHAQADNLQGARKHAGFEYRQVDLADPAACLESTAGVQHILHHAAMASVPASIKDPLACHRDTLDTTLNLLAGARAAGAKRFVLASTAAVYGETPAAPVGEDVASDPLSPYAAAKAAGELYVKAFAKLGVDGVSLRYFNVYGPRQRPDSAYSGVITIFASLARASHPITMFGDGLQTRDFVHVSDVCRANLLALGHRKPLGGVCINIGTGRSVTLLELARGVGAAVGRNVQIRHEPARQGDIRNSCADVSRAARLIGFRAEVELEPGLATIVGRA